METQERVVADVPMRWIEHGEGFPVVLVHGIPTGPALWRSVIPRVQGRCLAFEMVGYGDSIPAGRGRDISVGRQADFLLSWLDQLAIEQAVLVGHDLGGGVIQMAAARDSHRCAGLVLTNSIAYDSWPIPSVRALRAAGAIVERLPDALFKALIASFMVRGHDNLEVGRESGRIHARPYLEHGGAADLIRQIRSLDVHDTLSVQDDLSKLEVPARVVWGVADRFQKVGYGERLASDLGTELNRIEGGKHWTPEDHPDVVADAVNEVLKAIEPPVSS